MPSGFPPSARVCARDVAALIRGKKQTGFSPSAMTCARGNAKRDGGQRPSGFPLSALTGEESGSGAGFSPFRSRGAAKSNGVGGIGGSED